MKTNRISQSGASHAAQEIEKADMNARSNADMQLRMDSSLIQRTTVHTQATPLPPDHGWENDDESFAKRLVEHRLTSERGTHGTVEKVIRIASINPKVHECDVILKSGQVIKTLWATDTNKAILKSCVNDICEAFAYDYSVTDDGKLSFRLFKRWLIAPF